MNHAFKRPTPGASPAGLTVSKPLNLLAIARAPLSWGMVLVMIYTMVAVGRIQEVFLPLAKMRIGLLTGGLALIVWGLSPGSFGEKLPLQSKPVRYVIVLFALSIVTIPVAVWPGGSFHYLTAIYAKIVVLFVLILYWCRSVQDVRRLIWACCVAAVILVIAGKLTGSIEASRLSVKDATESYDANDLALFLDITLPLALYLFATSTWLLRTVLLGMMLVFLYGLVLTQSRGGFLALLVVGAVVLRRSAMKRSHKIVFTTVAVVVFGLIAGQAYWERIETIWAPKTEYDRTAGGRTELWKTGIVLLATRPWGVGIDGFAVAEGLSHGGKGKWNAAHNSFLQVAVELGIAGLIVFVLMLVSTYKLLRQAQLHLRPPPDKASLRFRRVPVTPVPLLGRPRKQLDLRDNLLMLASGLEISLSGFAVGGFFLSQAYGGMLYVLLALSVVCMRLAEAYQTVNEQGADAVLAPASGGRLKARAYVGQWPGPAKPPGESFGGGRWRAAEKGTS